MDALRAELEASAKALETAKAEAISAREAFVALNILDADLHAELAAAQTALAELREKIARGVRAFVSTDERNQRLINCGPQFKGGESVLILLDDGEGK